MIYSNFILLLTIYFCACEDCPPNVNDQFTFASNMSVSQAAIYHKYAEITCCVVGFTDIKWEFRRNKSQNWSYTIPGNYDLSDENRKISFSAVEFEDTGYYKCTAKNYDDDIIYGETLLVVGCSKPHTKMIITNRTLETNFHELGTGRLCCSLSTINWAEAIFVFWIYKNSNSTIRTWQFNIMSEFITSKSGRISIYVDPKITKSPCEEYIKVDTCFEIERLQITDSGNCTCRFSSFDMVEQEFTLRVLSDVTNTILYIYCSVSIGSAIVLLFLLLWIFYYDLMIISTLIVGSKSKNFSIAVLIIYDDQDQLSFSTAVKISEILSRKGFSTYLFDRDKKFGCEFHSDYLSSMAESNQILFLCTEKFLENESMLFCLNNSTQYKNKRNFVFFNSRKALLQHFRNLKEINQIYQVIKFSTKYNVWKSNYDKDSFMRRRFISWIMSGFCYSTLKRNIKPKTIEGHVNDSYKIDI